MSDLTRRGPGRTPRSSTSTEHGTQLAAHGTRRPRQIPAPHAPYAGASQGHGPIGYVHLSRLAEKEHPPLDIEAAFLALVDRIGRDRAKALIMRGGTE